MKKFLSLFAFVVIVAGLSASSSQARNAGSPIYGFGSNGSTLTGFSSAPVNGTFQDMKVGSDGSALVFGTAARERFTFGQFKPDGSIDSDFGSGGFATGGITPQGKPFFASRLAQQSDGKLIVSGSNDILAMKSSLIRYFPSGAPDPFFGASGSVKLPLDARQIAVDSHDRIVVAMADGFKTRIARFTRDGEPDVTFGVEGSETYPFSATSGLIGLSLAHDRITLSAPQYILRLLADGAPDTEFGGDGIVSQETRGTTVVPDGRMVIVNGTGQVTRLLNDGTPDPGFGTGGNANYVSGANNAVTVDSSGRVLVTGTTFFNGPSSPRDFETFRLTADGHLDTTFAGDGIATTDLAGFENSPLGSDDTAYVVSTLPDGRVMVGGTSQYNNGLSALVLIRYTESGDLDPSFGNGTGIVSQRPLAPSDDRAFAGFAGPDGTIVSVGKSANQTAVMRYAPTGRLDRDFGAGGKVSARLTTGRGEMAESGARLPNGEQLVCSSSAAGSTVSLFGADGQLDPGFGEDGSVKVPSLRRCYSTLRLGDGRILLGGIDANNVVRVVRLNPDGGINVTYGDGGFVTGPQLVLSGGGFRPAHFALAPNGDLVMAGDQFGATLARFRSDGQPRASFGEDGVLKLNGFGSSGVRIGKANSAVVTSVGRIVIGGVVGGDAAIVKLEKNGQPVKKFGRHGVVRKKVLSKSSIEALKVQDNGLITAVGAARPECVIRIGCLDRVLVLRYKPNGKPDTRFSKDGMAIKNYGVRSKASGLVLGKKTITIVGYAETALDRQQFLVARFHR